MTTYLTDNEATRQEVMRLIDNNKTYKVTIEEVTDNKRRTLLQNAAMHKDFSNVAKICNDNNIDVSRLFELGKKASPVNEKIMKEFWHSVLERMDLPPSTSKLTTDQVSMVRGGIERAFATTFGVDIGDFPSLESMSRQALIVA